MLQKKKTLSKCCSVFITGINYTVQYIKTIIFNISNILQYFKILLFLLKQMQFWWAQENYFKNILKTLLIPNFWMVVYTVNSTSHNKSLQRMPFFSIPLMYLSLSAGPAAEGWVFIAGFGLEGRLSSKKLLSSPSSGTKSSTLWTVGGAAADTGSGSVEIQEEVTWSGAKTSYIKNI